MDVKKLLCVVLALTSIVYAINVGVGVQFTHDTTNTTYWFLDNQTFDSITHDQDNNVTTGHWSWDTLTLSIYCADPQYSGTNVSIGVYNTTFVNFTIMNGVSCSRMNFSVGVLNVNTTFKLYVDGVVKDEQTTSEDGYFFSNTSVGTGSVSITLEKDLTCHGKSYGLWNGTAYVWSANQTFNYYCFPIHDDCVPYHETVNRSLINVSAASALSYFKFRLNETNPRLNFKMYDEYNSTFANNYNLSTNKIIMHGDAPSDSYKQYWLWIDSYYPFSHFHPTLEAEVCV